MGFRFGLSSVLKHRQRLEDIAQREYAEAQQAVDEILSQIEAMYREIDETRAAIFSAQQSGRTRDLQVIHQMEAFIDGQKIRIERTRLRARELLMTAEEKLEALITAAREKKILMKLKDRKFEEYKAWMNRLEAKALDDMTMTRTARGRK
ncbi:MAG: flagellar export protein FliJ [Bdellovibrionales bacterium]